jgi:hypothetical protein
LSTSEDKGNIADAHASHDDHGGAHGHSETVAPFVSESSWQDRLLACLTVLVGLKMIAFMYYWLAVPL